MDPIIILNNSKAMSHFYDWKPVIMALEKQVKQVADTWYIEAPVIEAYVTKLDSTLKNIRIIELTDAADVKDADGYHSESSNGVAFAKVFVGPILANGGGVPATVSHEIIEMMINPYANRWVHNDGDGFDYAEEIADPVQEQTYEIDGVAVSNFVTPDWFDERAASWRKFDYLKNLSEPFRISEGGYMIRKQSGTVQQVFGRTCPEWKRMLKKTTGRYIDICGKMGIKT